MSLTSDPVGHEYDRPKLNANGDWPTLRIGSITRGKVAKNALSASASSCRAKRGKPGTGLRSVLAVSGIDEGCREGALPYKRAGLPRATAAN